MTKQTLTRKLNKLAEIKFQMKILKEKEKKLQNEILESGEAPQCFTSKEYGKLTLTTRKNYFVLSNEKIAETIGLNTFINNATIAIGKIKKLVGEEGLNYLIDKDIVIRKPDSLYFTLK